MTLALLLPYLGLVGLMTVTPGPDAALVIRNTARLGWRAGLATSLGCVAGVQVWTVAAALGVGALASVSQTAFTVLRVAGAAYLVLLGLQMLWHAIRPARGGGGARATERRGLRPFQQGLLNNLLNPKALAFFTALLPQFLPPHGSATVNTLLLGAIAGCAWLAGLLTFGLLAAGARRFLQRPAVSRAIDGLTGGVLIALGVRVALERR